jgi:hypothetical protein
MEYAYLVASLPRLELGRSLPLSAEEFLFACAGVLQRDHYEDVRAIVEDRPADVRAAEGRRHLDTEIQLRNAVARIRSRRAGAEAAAASRPHAGFDVRVEEAAARAMAAEDPLERELVLDRHRWALLDELASLPAFGVQAVLAYAFQLLLVRKWASLSEELGLAVLDQVVADNLAGAGL